ncbi:hypothetical protein [Streptacidiphilus carbonis]|jgi:hypothetical protein|uniref:hypothetical protein n=1 Tax=Streptacidiphilus carbonis TaxID=105422 RepID=UPI0005A9098A|nr:hypothetical protein [Streptacidiphilus carbonis]
MAAPEVPPSHDTQYLDARARVFGWQVVRDRDRLVLSLPDHTVHAVFWHDGGFRYARCTGPGAGGTELTLTQTIEFLREHGATTPPL